MNTMQLVKRRMFAMRNGVIADTLRRAGSPYRIIFGLNLPQIIDIAREFGKDRALADALHENSTTRCSRLLAPMVMPEETFTQEEASRWIDDVMSVEEADILCHRLLRRLPFAAELALTMNDRPTDLSRYCCLRLARNIRGAHPDVERSLAKNAESDFAPIKRLVAEIMSD